MTVVRGKDKGWKRREKINIQLLRASFSVLWHMLFVIVRLGR